LRSKLKHFTAVRRRFVKTKSVWAKGSSPNSCSTSTAKARIPLRKSTGRWHRKTCARSMRGRINGTARVAGAFVDPRDDQSGPGPQHPPTPEPCRSAGAGAGLQANALQAPPPRPERIVPFPPGSAPSPCAKNSRTTAGAASLQPARHTHVSSDPRPQLAQDARTNSSPDRLDARPLQLPLRGRECGERVQQASQIRKVGFMGQSPSFC